MAGEPAEPQDKASLMVKALQQAGALGILAMFIYLFFEYLEKSAQCT